MSRTLTTTRWRNALLLLTLISVLLQVQSAFACQMMEVSGPAKDCCCGDPVDRADLLGLTQTHHGDPCCDFSLEVSFNELDVGSAPLWSPAQLLDHDPPDVPLAYTLPIVPVPVRHATVASYSVTNPSDPGSQTYLATQRLRI